MKILIIFFLFLCYNTYAQNVSHLTQEEKEVFLQFLKDVKNTPEEFKKNPVGKCIYGNSKRVGFDTYQRIAFKMDTSFDVLLLDTSTKYLPCSRLWQKKGKKGICERIEISHIRGSQIVELRYIRFTQNKMVSNVNYGLLPNSDVLFVQSDSIGTQNCFACSGDTTYAKRMVYAYHLTDYYVHDMAEIPRMMSYFPCATCDEVSICEKHKRDVKELLKKL